MKQYTYVQGKIRFMVPLHEMRTGDLVAMTRKWTTWANYAPSAASGVATKFLSRQKSRTAAIIGTGGQARTQLEAIAGAKARVGKSLWPRCRQARKVCEKEMTERLGFPGSKRSFLR